MAHSGLSGDPTAGIWRRFALLVPLVIIIALASWLYASPKAGTYSITSIYQLGAAPLTADDVSVDDPEVVEIVSVEQLESGATQVELRALADGEATVTMNAHTPPEDAQSLTQSWHVRVSNGAIVEGANFSGWEAVPVGLFIVLAASLCLFVSVVVRLWRRSWFGYEMIACGGAALFLAFQLAVLAAALLAHVIRDLGDLVFYMANMAQIFSLVALAPALAVALLVSASNIVLVRREGMRPVNLLGIAATFALVAVYALWYLADRALSAHVDVYAALAAQSVAFTALAFGECLFVSTVVCGWLAARHAPRHAADYTIVLGCGIRADGTPSPLLAGRIDRALAFDRACREEGGTPTVFVPSGGQGPDEPASEAASMAAYLASEGVEADRIVPEDRSATTRQNMAYSREAIERHAGRNADELNIAFSTTNYHVLRGYVCAHQAGMAAEGMGAPTRAYFWPNAFLREFAGLLVWERRMIALVYIAIALVYGAAAYLCQFA